MIFWNFFVKCKGLILAFFSRFFPGNRDTLTKDSRDPHRPGSHFILITLSLSPCRPAWWTPSLPAPPDLASSKPNPPTSQTHLQPPDRSLQALSGCITDFWMLLFIFRVASFRANALVNDELLEAWDHFWCEFVLQVLVSSTKEYK